ncbi:hypothetical protein ACFVMC_21090 [Nocardia sp. NPDC127579]
MSFVLNLQATDGAEDRGAANTLLSMVSTAMCAGVVAPADN